VLDTTDNLTESGTVEFLGPSDMDKALWLGQELYWLRAEVTEIKFQSFDETAGNFLADRVKEATPAKLSIIDILLSQRINYQRYKTRRASDIPLILTGPCTPETIFHPKFTTPEAVKGVPAAPKVKAIHVNTTWAVQAETVNDEILGSSDGTATKSFSLSRAPVIFENVWVQEPFKPENEPSENVTVTDTGEVWVRWHAVEDFFGSDGQSRHYTIDSASGQITFGNGVKGMLPPIGGRIKATYQIGGGTKGNIAAGEVKNLITSIASIDKVVNPDSAQGGADTESLERILQRGPKRIQHRQRAVAKEDYEWLAKEASGAVARAKCIPNFSDAGEEKPGCVSVIIVSEGKEDRPEASPELVRVVEKYLRSRSPASLSNFTVAGPTYVGISVKAELYVASMDSASGVKFKAMERLAAFLHPLYGGYDGKGWGFGEMPCNSDILALLQKIPEVDHVEELNVTMRDEKTGESFVVKDAISLPGYALISSDMHRIEVRCTEVG
jgi:predicted phage baseplate assembly protein